MSISTFSLFESAKKGLTANQFALNIVSQNVSNAATTGYTRQDVILKNSAPIYYSLNMQSISLGSHVEIGEVRQVRDAYIESQIRSQNSINSYWNTNKSYLEKIQTFLNDNSDSGIRGLLDKFWKSLEDVSKSAQSIEARSELIQNADSFTKGVKYIALKLNEIKKEANDSIREKIEKVNLLAKQIAKINEQLSKYEKSDQKIHGLRDERLRLISSLSELLDINVLNYEELDDGQILVNGKPLVLGSKYFEFETYYNIDGLINLKLNDTNFTTNSNPNVATFIPYSNVKTGNYELNVKQLATSTTITSKIYNLNENEYLSKYGINDGEIEINGYRFKIKANSLTIKDLIKNINESSANVLAKLDSGGKLVFTSKDTGIDSKIILNDINNSNLFEKLGMISAITANPNPPILNTASSLNISGVFSINGKKISVIQNQTDSLKRIVDEINTNVTDVIALLVQDTNGNYKIKLKAKDNISQITLNDEEGNLLFRLGFLDSPNTKQNISPVNISLGKNAEYYVNNIKYESNSNIAENQDLNLKFILNNVGITQINTKLTISNGEIGSLFLIRDEIIPKFLNDISDFVKMFANEFNKLHMQGFDLNGEFGKTFFKLAQAPNISADNIINSFSVNEEILNDPTKLAAAGFDEEYFKRTGKFVSKGIADNTIALKYTELKTKALFKDGTSLNEKYANIIFNIGNYVENAQKNSKTQNIILDNLKLKKESVSGVSLDEEISNMMKFQHAYNASAKMINVIDGMLDTIINRLVR